MFFNKKTVYVQSYDEIVKTMRASNENKLLLRINIQQTSISYKGVSFFHFSFRFLPQSYEKLCQIITLMCCLRFVKTEHTHCMNEY